MPEWHEGRVDVAREHIEIRHGDLVKDDSEPLVLVARVAPGRSPRSYVVEFAYPPGAPDAAEMLASARRDLDFFLVELGERDPWIYALYHCRSAANAYAWVHWLHQQPEGATQARQTRERKVSNNSMRRKP